MGDAGVLSKPKHTWVSVWTYQTLRQELEVQSGLFHLMPNQSPVVVSSHRSCSPLPAAAAVAAVGVVAAATVDHQLLWQQSQKLECVYL